VVLEALCPKGTFVDGGYSPFLPPRVPHADEFSADGGSHRRTAAPPLRTMERELVGRFVRAWEAVDIGLPARI
jgi:hypothetical protein